MYPLFGLIIAEWRCITFLYYDITINKCDQVKHQVLKIFIFVQIIIKCVDFSMFFVSYLLLLFIIIDIVSFSNITNYELLSRQLIIHNFKSSLIFLNTLKFLHNTQCTTRNTQWTVVLTKSGVYTTWSADTNLAKLYNCEKYPHWDLN